MNSRSIFVSFLIIILLATSLNVMAADLPSFIINETGTDYANASSESMGDGTNSYNTNYIKGSAVFPLVQGFKPVNVGLSDCQPIIVDDLIVVQGGNNISVVNKHKGNILATFSFTGKYPLFKIGTLFAHRLSEEEYVIVGADGKRIIALSLKADHEVNKLPDGSEERALTGASLSLLWDYMVSSSNYKLSTQAVSLLTDVSSSGSYYFGFATSDGSLIVLNGATGNLVSGGNLKQEGALSGSAPVVMPASNGKFSTLLAAGSSYMVSANMNSGALYKDSLINDQMSFEWAGIGDINSPVALSYVNINGAAVPVVVLQSKEGIVIGYRVDGGNRVPLFKIDKYKSPGINGFSIKGKYCVVTQGDGNVFVFDMERAVDEGSADTDINANAAIMFSKKMDKLASSAISLTVASEKELASGDISEEISREVLILGTKKGSLEMYYLDQYDSSTGSPIPIPNAFKVKEVIYSKLNFDSGISSQLAYGGGSLAFIDGQGNLHCYSAEKSDNLALANMTNSSGTLQKGKTYEAAVDVVNYMGKDLKDVDMVFLMDDVEVHRSKIDVKAEGVTVYLKYTLPSNFDKKELVITAKINDTKVLYETDYEDNSAFVKLKIADDVDLAITSIKYDRYPADCKVSAVVVVENLSKGTNVENVPVDFKLTIDGQSASLKRNISLLAGNKATLVFSFTTPDQNASATLLAEVNKTDIYKEKDKSNNSKTIVASIEKSPRLLGCEESRVWTEWESRIEVIGYTPYWYDSITGGSGGGNPIYGPVWYDFDYEAIIKASATVTPTTLKAGRGFGVNVTSSVSYGQISGAWSRSATNTPSAPSTAKVTTNFGKGVYTLQKTGGSGLSATFSLPVDSTSSVGARMIYTPKDLAGTKSNPESYKVEIDVYGSCAGGDLCVGVNKGITINGDMYEDDNTY